MSPAMMRCADRFKCSGSESTQAAKPVGAHLHRLALPGAPTWPGEQLFAVGSLSTLITALHEGLQLARGPPVYVRSILSMTGRVR